MAEYIKVAKIHEIPGISGKRLNINGKKIALFKKKNSVYAIRNSCPHQGAELSEGHIIDSNVVCPLHGWQFNLKTGSFSGNENIRIPTYRVKVENDDVYILMNNE